MQRRPSPITRRGFLRLASAGAVASFGVAEAGFAEAQGLPGLRRVRLTVPQLPPAWEGLVLVQVSDVHAGRYMSARRMRRIRDLVARIPADMIVFTGDQMDRRESDAPAFASGFAGLEAPLGVYGILGNHDHYIDPAISVHALERAGATPLVNDSRTFERDGQHLALVGLEDLAAGPGRLPQFSLLGQHPDAFRICLCHQPQGWHDAADAGAHLTLAGHTHGGQIALPTRNVNVARFQTRYISGPYRREDAFLYVSRGIGVGAVPVRVGAPPEIDVISLHRPSAAVSAAVA